MLERTREALGLDQLPERIECVDVSHVQGSNPVASMVVFIGAGVAYTWKTAFDEEFARFSPGKLILAEITAHHLDDPNIVKTDSCAVPDHPIMSRFWMEREPMETLVIGLNPRADRNARQVAAQMDLYRQTRDMAKKVQGKLRSLVGRR